MSAEPVSAYYPQPWLPDATRQRMGNLTIEDVLALPQDAPRVELRDGVMIVVPSPTIGHQDISFMLSAWLRRHSPATYRPSAAVGVAVDIDTTLEPDVVLLLREGIESNNHYFRPEQVVLAVEIVSPSTRRRDRLEKPALYADAGIPHFWRIEQDPHVHVFAYSLDKDRRYQLVADSDDKIVLAEPFPIELAIADLIS